MLQGHEIQHHPPSETCDQQRFRTRKAWTFMVTWLYTLGCTGPVGRLATVHPSAGCVGTVRLTSQAGGLSKSLSTDTPPRYYNRQQMIVVLQESSDRWRGLTCLPTILTKILSCTMQGLNSFRCLTPSAPPRTNLCQPWFWEARRCRILCRSSLMIRRTMLITCGLRQNRSQSLSASV